jgi:hypothetical protein
MDPGSAAHHAATTAALRCIRGTQAARVKKKARIKRAFEFIREVRRS